MNNNPNQPRDYDAVLGGQTPPPLQGAVLGGIEGVISCPVASVVYDGVVKNTVRSRAF